MTGIERGSDEDTLRMVREQRPADRAAGDPLSGEPVSTRPYVPPAGHGP